MLVGIHQPHYVPWLRYFEKIARCDAFVVLDNIQFSKNGWQNRNAIKGPQGRQLLTVPVHAHQDAAINEVTIDNKVHWQAKHWKSIEQAYRRAPHFDQYAPALKVVYEKEWTHLHELNAHMLAIYLEALAIKTPITYASDLNVLGTATDRLVNIIHAVGGDAYYSGAHALEVYLDADALAAAGIALKLQQWTPPVYPQLHGDFLPDLSIIDLLMNCGPDSLAIVMGDQT
jgi:hypothetical protein